MTPNFIFYIGTSAELIKLIPVIQAFNRNNINYKIISSGQTDLKATADLQQSLKGPLDESADCAN